MVRFGNVLASSGSVVPLFQEQIRRGGPVTVTHPDVIRYFMTIPEAAQLVIQAGSMAKGGDVFVLDMGRPVRIDDLARRMISLMGLTVRDAANPEGDIEIEYTGLRTAEKLFEELLIGTNVTGTDHPMIMRAMEHSLPWAAHAAAAERAARRAGQLRLPPGAGAAGGVRRGIPHGARDQRLRLDAQVHRCRPPEEGKVADFAAKRRHSDAAAKPTSRAAPYLIGPIVEPRPAMPLWTSDDALNRTAAA